MGRRIWINYEGPTVIRSGEAIRQIRPGVIQISKTVKESWPSIKDSHGSLDLEDTCQYIVIFLTGKSKARGDLFFQLAK
jgi:hypothetical protein